MNEITNLLQDTEIVLKSGFRIMFWDGVVFVVNEKSPFDIRTKNILETANLLEALKTLKEKDY